VIGGPIVLSDLMGLVSFDLVYKLKMSACQGFVRAMHKSRSAKPRVELDEKIAGQFDSDLLDLATFWLGDRDEETTITNRNVVSGANESVRRRGSFSNKFNPIIGY
jgi:hypothetical protein